MTRAGDCFVRLCVKLYDIPAAVFCVFLFLTQAAVMDYYLINHLTSDHYYWVALDLVNLVLLISCIYHSHAGKLKEKDPTKSSYSFAWVSWLVINSAVGAKTIVVFVVFAVELEEDTTFFGPNTFKTAIALGSCVFLLLLTTQHDAPLGSERRRFIDEMTCFVFFDLLDTADILEILFEKQARDEFWLGLKEVILAVATLNLVIPTVPLLTLSRTKFGIDKLQRRLIYLHRMLVVLAVNVPNLLIRLNLWHGYNVAISPFTLKNIIMICITVYEFYLHKKGKYQEHERERLEGGRKNDRHTELVSSKYQNPEQTVEVIGNNCDNNVEDSCPTDQRMATHF